MKIFSINEGKVSPSIEILLIEPFKEIWNRDKSKNKEKAINELSYIEFMCSPKKSNPFYGYKKEVREEKIISSLFKSKYNPDKLVSMAMDKYTEWLHEASPILSFCEAAMRAAAEIENYYNSVDLTERDSRGNFVHKLTDVARSLKESTGLVKSVNELRDNVEKELYETFRTKSNKEIGHYED